MFQAEDGIRDLVRSRGLGDVYKRQEELRAKEALAQVEREKSATEAQRKIAEENLVVALSLIHI